MNDLIQLILTLPPKKLGLMIYLRHCLNDPLIRSIFEASEKNLSKIKKDDSFADPIESAMECFHRDIIFAFKQIIGTKEMDVTEEFRLPLTIQLLVTSEYKNNFPELLGKIEYLLDLYEKYNFGYIDNALTSLKGALEMATGEQPEAKNDPILSAVVDALQKKYLAESKQEKIDHINAANNILDIYTTAAQNKTVIERINVFCELNNEFDLIFFALKTYTINNEIEEKIEPIRQIISSLRACMFDHEKNAVERLDCFYKLFLAQKCNIDLTGVGLTHVEDIDKTVEIFLAKISDILEQNKCLISKSSWQLYSLFGYAASFIQPFQVTALRVLENKAETKSAAPSVH